MTDKPQDILPIDPLLRKGFGVRLGTLVIIRWLGISGQLLALLGVHFLLGFDVQLNLTLPTLLALVLPNLWFTLRADSNTQLSETQSAAHLTFDLTHLAAMLFLTGGLANPFAVLMLAPASVSASILGRSSTKLLIFASVSLVTTLAFTPFPLPWDGPPPELNTLIKVGIWISLCFTLVFLTLYMARLGREGRERSRALVATQAALAHEQRLAALGTLAAAAAHELGTPLGTILLASKELLDTWEGDDETRIDLELIVEQTSRCRAILSDLREQRQPGNSNHFTSMQVEAILREAGSPHEQRGTQVRYTTDGENSHDIRRSPELMHAFRNIIENAVGFSLSYVDVNVQWQEDTLSISISDDGPGFDPAVIKKLGEPYVTTRQPTPGEDGGLGLGLFISKTLLERTGARLGFANGAQCGATVTMVWPRKTLLDNLVDTPTKEQRS